MNSKYLISIIIPVYNVETYFCKCIESILNQTYQNIEIILIDDGSTDLSGKICDDYAKEDSRIKVMHKKNQGVSCARNDGLKSAKGEYVFFIDSDDYIDIDAIEKMVNEIDKDEIIKISHKLVKNDKTIKTISHIGIFSKEEYIKKVLIGDIGGHSWGYLLKKDIIDNVLFDEKTSCMEDTLFIINCILKAEKIKCINTTFYNHVINENGITASANRIERNINDYMYSLNEIEKVLDKAGWDYKNDILKKRFKLIESELAKCSDKKKIQNLFDNVIINENLTNIYKSSRINVLEKIYIKIILKKRYSDFILYNNFRKKIKKLKWRKK